MHHPSEHTIDGKRYDLELQIIHTFHKTAEEIRNEAAMAFSGRNLAEEKKEEKNTDYSITSILFSVNDYDKSVTPEKKEMIEEFFQSMHLEKERHVPDKLHLEMVNMIDFGNRWVYRGSLTIPPCNRYVYWNVVQKVFPVSADVIS